MVKVAGLGVKVTRVPFLPGASPATLSGASGTPSAKAMKCSLPPRQTVSSSRVESAFTTDTPTPCRPPETL